MGSKPKMVAEIKALDAVAYKEYALQQDQQLNGQQNEIMRKVSASVETVEQFTNKVENDMRTKSFYGFAIFLQMLNGTAQQNRPFTYLIPGDTKLSENPISTHNLQQLIESHAIIMPLTFNDLLHFPRGSLVPTFVGHKMFRINNRGRSSFSVNNAHIVIPNICDGTFFRCHGIEAVLQFDNGTII